MIGIQDIEREIEPLRGQLKEHRLYTMLEDIEDIKVFMSYHVYAVWDFMSLLKALQNHLTCTKTPWIPSENSKVSRFINEIVLGEESDIDQMGRVSSHFELYIDAMVEVGANTKPVLTMIDSIKSGNPIKEIIREEIPKSSARSFVDFTFDVIGTNEPHKLASAFTFGREDLIPDMFLAIIDKTSETNKRQFPQITYYLNRHIELDGDDHGPLSLEMVRELCGNDQEKWKEALSIAKESMQQRINLWDGIAEAIMAKKLVMA